MWGHSAIAGMGYPATNIPIVLAAKIGDSKEYELSSTAELQQAKRIIVTEDTAETGDAFEYVTRALNDHAAVKPELFALTRKPRAGKEIVYPGNYDTALLLPDIWVWCGAGMNSNQIPTDHPDYAELVARERTANVFLIRTKDEPDLKAYFEYLGKHHYFGEDPYKQPLFYLLWMLYDEEPMPNEVRFAVVMDWVEHLQKH